MIHVSNRMFRIPAAVACLVSTVIPMASAGLTTDIEFAKPGDTGLTLDAFFPEGAGPRPACILVHGGGFTAGTKTSYIKPLFDPLSKAGFTWFTINYRLAPRHRWPACAEDVATAIAWVRAHAEEYKVDPRRIALIGESAGGHLVSWAGLTDQGTPALAAVVAFYAPNDLVTLMKQRQKLDGIGSLLGTTELNEETWTRLGQISPGGQVKPQAPPFLLIHGDKDTRVPLEQSQLFQKRMLEAGNTCDLITVPGGVHGMGAWKSPPSDYQEQMIQWLRDHLK